MPMIVEKIKKLKNKRENTRNYRGEFDCKRGMNSTQALAKKDQIQEFEKISRRRLLKGEIEQNGIFQ